MDKHHPVLIDWKHKFHTVVKIDKPEVLTRGGYWKPKPRPEILPSEKEPKGRTV